MTRSTQRGSARAGALVGIATVAVLAGSLLAPLGASATENALDANAPVGNAATENAPTENAPVAGASAPDGLTPETAAASCWEIKQNNPGSADGVYWLVTPTLVDPQQFYCDQTTLGGGWVMIGRGREGWKENYNGVGTPEQITTTPSGTAAFAPAQLPAKTVDGLLDGARPDQLPPDSIRVHRASAVDGSRWQEVRFSLARRDRWNWTMAGGNPIKDWIIGGFTGTGGWTGAVGWGGPSQSGFGHDTGWNGSYFAQRQSHRYLMGWSYGAEITGQDTPTSYLWAPAGAGFAIPFAQMFVRPQLKLADLDFGTVPATGTAASTLRSIPDSNAQRTVWGVSGLANGKDGELNVEVAEFGQVGNTVFAGGNFRYVQQSRDGAGRVEQPYLAGFDVNSGQWVSTFRPQLNGQVKAIAALPDGRVAIGGQFTQVDGTPQVGLAFLDPATGRLSGPQVAVQSRAVGAVPSVHDLDVKNGYLYVAGAMTHLTAVGSGKSASAWNGGRILLSTSTPDTNWNANLNGTAIAVDASDRGDRTYFSGYFTRKQTTSTPSAVALQTVAGAPLVSPLWVPTFSEATIDANGNYQGYIWQNGVTEVGDRVYLGGSQHSLFSYDRSTFQLVGGSIAHEGGDMQTVDDNGSVVIAGCHCGDEVYQDKYLKREITEPWTEVDKINLAGAWDAATGHYIPDWSPVVRSRAGQGVWGSFFDSTGTLWVGGDLTDSMRAGGVNQWSGGFIRFAPRDSTAPTTPGPISATPTASGDQQVLTWGGSTDAGGGLVYEVLRGNRVVATTTAATYTAPVTAEPTNWFVRARDAVGNRSASTAAFTVQPAPASALTLIGNGDTWSWRSSTDPLPSTWSEADFDDADWTVGRALFGRGISGATTDLDPSDAATKPVSAQFRKSFAVQDAASVVDGTVSVIANDGVILYLNGKELGRVRMPDGTPTQNTTATAVVSQKTASGARSVFSVPAGTLVDGTNVLAASVHANYRATPDLGFDLAFTARRSTAPGPVTDLTATATADSATLSWTAPASANTAASYVITRAGNQVGTVAAPETAFTETDLAASTAYEYGVTALGADGEASPVTAVTATTTATAPDPVPDPDAGGDQKADPGQDAAPDADPAADAVTVAEGSTWSWRSSTEALPADWNAVGFDDSDWSTGEALFGRGVTSATTDLGAGGDTAPLSAQFRHTFTVDDPAAVHDGSVTVVADDGVVLYLNGVELGRSNLPDGAITAETYATAAPRATTAAAHRVTFTVPAKLLAKGENVLAASVHANFHLSPDLSFDLGLTMPRG
ncbi:fibrinogen-like YCDxxxxGGGW domain-containing protein [Microbacterium sp. NPDC060132]|uniref:fibrinogen-like YCDxxxxGGGW domain-containing protein n=1 Tax=unclassified Microbacterium TaxID=2609290 RepID=UPI003669EDD5